METETIASSFGEKNIFEAFYNLIEKHRLNSNDFQLGDFYDILSNFDLSYQKFNERADKKSSKIMAIQLEQGLGIFYRAFKITGFSNRPIFESLKRFISWFEILLKESSSIKSKTYFLKNLTENFPSFESNYFRTINDFKIPEYNDNNEDYVDYILNTIDQFEDALCQDLGMKSQIGNHPKRSLYIFGENFHVTEFSWENSKRKFNRIRSHFEMAIDIHLIMKNNDGAELLGNFNSIIQGLAIIPNCKVKLEHIYVGSIRSKVTLILKDLLAKEEVKEVLNVAKEGITKKITGESISDLREIKAITEKTIAETELIEKEIESKPTKNESKLNTALDLERKSIENERMKVLLAKEKLELIKLASDLVNNGIIQSDNIEININEVLYIVKNGNNISTTDTDLDQIT